MWDALQQQSFLVGAALILIYQAARFGEIYAGDPVTSRYVSLLPGTGVRDFAGPHAYHWALAAFLVASLVVYSALCLISPNVLTGAVKLLTNNADADQISEGVPLPLYIAALFMGLTQPIIPGLSQFQTAQLNFFHDRIEVPRRIIDISGSLTVAIEARAGEDRQQLVAEVRKLVGNDFLTSLQPHGDLAFYKLQLEKMEVDNGSLEATNQGQLREGAPRLDRTAGALRAGCGVAQVRAEAAHQGGPEARNSVVRYQARRPPGIAGLIASGVLFFAGLFIIAELLLQLAGPVDALFGKSITEGLWPSTLDYSFQELWSIALPIGVCMFIAVCKLAPRGEARQSDPEPELDADASPFDDFLDFIRSNAAILLLCIFTTIAIKIGLMFWEYGTFNLPPEARSPLRLTLPALQSFITLAVCVFTAWYLVSAARKEPGHGPSFVVTLLLIAGATGFLALLYDFAFLDQYLNAHPESRPGSEHHLFTVIANALVSICAFVSVAVFFKARKIKRSATRSDVRADVPNRAPAVPPVQAPPLVPTDAVEVASDGPARLRA